VAAAVRRRQGNFHQNRPFDQGGTASTQPASGQRTANSNGLSVLEVGPGTGAFTAELVRLLEPQDRLTLVELNPAFVTILRKRFQTEPSFQRLSGQVQIRHLPIQQMPDGLSYDFVVSGLPLNSFSPAVVRAILRKLKRLVAPGGMLSFFEYLWIRRLKEAVSSRTQRRSVRMVERIIASYLCRYEIRRDIVLANLPPAVVHHLRFW